MMMIKEATMKIEIDALPPEEWSPNWLGSPIVRHRAGKMYQQLVFYSCVSARNLAMRQPAGWVPFQVALLDLTFIFPEHRDRAPVTIIEMREANL